MTHVAKCRFILFCRHCNISCTHELSDPATGKEICNLPDLDEKSCIDVVKAAAKATPVVALGLTVHNRRDILLEWQGLMINATDDLAFIITSENGKPLAESRSEVFYAADFLGWFAGEAVRIDGSVIQPSNPGTRGFVIKQPVGLVSIITPWNFPAAMITRKVGAAFAAGCASIVKPAADTPLAAIAFAELGRRAGVPNAALTIVTTMKHTVSVGKVLTQHPDIRKMSFTGSSPVGKLLAAQCADTVKRVSLELGGNAPFIVFNDADLRKTTEAILASKFRHSGQTCVCTNKVRQFRLGDGRDTCTTHGPLINAAAVRKVEKHVEDAVQKGARVLVGGRPAVSLGVTFFEPTVLADVSPQALCVQQETFGPILPLIFFDTEKEVVEMTNSTRTGLAGYIASENWSKAWRLAESLQLGMVGINTGAISDALSPFGGVKESGQGREGSTLGIDEYLEAGRPWFPILKFLPLLMQDMDQEHNDRPP